MCFLEEESWEIVWLNTTLFGRCLRECVCVSVCCGRGLGMVARDGMGRRGTPGEGVQLWLAGSAATEVLRKALVVLSFELQ